MKTYTQMIAGVGLLAVISLSQLSAQTMLQKVVISNGSGVTSNATTHFNYTVGEAAVGTAANATTVGQFGFWHAGNVASGIHSDVTSGAISGMVVAPDPAPSEVTVIINVARAGTLDVQLYDPTGRHVCTVFTGHRDQGETRLRHDVRKLPQGKYIVSARMPGVLMQSQITVVR